MRSTEKHPAQTRFNWLDNPIPSASTIALALQSSTRLMTESASATNKTMVLGKPRKVSSVPTPRIIIQSQKALLDSHRAIKCLNNDPDKLVDLKNKHNIEKNQHRKLLRKESSADSVQRDTYLLNVFDKNSSSFFGKMRAGNRNTSRKINQLHVSNKTYTEENVPDGFMTTCCI